MTAAKSGGGSNRRRNGRKPGVKAILHARLFEGVRVTINGGARRCTVLEAIMLQLLQKTATGNAPARRLLLSYQAFVARAVKPCRDLVFVESEEAPASPVPVPVPEEVGDGGRV